MPSQSSIRTGLRRLNLQAYYSAINVRWFDGRLPADVLITWKTQKQLERVKGMHHVYGCAGFTREFKQRIVLNIDAHVREPNQLLNTFVHECIHLLMPFGDELNRKPKWFRYDKTLTTTHTEHGERFGAESRRINALLGYKLMTDEECSHGIAGRKWAYDNVTEKCGHADYVDECGLDTAVSCHFEGTRREMRKHKKEHDKKQRAWCEKFDSKGTTRSSTSSMGCTTNTRSLRIGFGRRSLHNYRRACVPSLNRWYVSGRNIGQPWLYLKDCGDTES